ncbi:PEP/pyruvate-binding domain-containing protein [Bradymonas sediminis]|nr:PEP/pyruvate-binding domain-containing protein [Bradymonas sediminis]
MNPKEHDEIMPPGAQDFRYSARVGGAIWPAARAGGKANGLHLLVRQGFDVPPAFCILSDAFEQALACCVHRVESLDELREKLLGFELSEELVAEVDAQMRAIEPGWPASADSLGWAVRSSALDEDAAGHSFAGQQKTVLGVQTRDEIFGALREVWASLYETGAMLYSDGLTLGGKPRSMAVVIQRMIAPGCAGVMFSQNPLSAEAEQIVVNAAKGMGLQVVEGGSAQTYYLEKSSGYVEGYESGDGAGDEATAKPLLDEGQLKELAACARQLEYTFAEPMDIEWAYAPRAVSASSARAESAHGIRPTLYLLQARPITTSAKPAGAAPAPVAAVWTNVNVGEALPGVATPLTWSIIRGFSRLGFERAFGSLGLEVPEDYELVGAFRGRIYLNLSQFMSIASAIPLLKPQTLFEMAGGGDIAALDGNYEQRDSREFLFRLPRTALKIAASQLTTPLVAPFWSRHFKDWRDQYFEQDLSQLSHLEFRDKLDEIDRVFARTGLVMLACSSNFLMSYVLMREAMRLWAGEESAGQEQTLLGALDVESAQAGYDLMELGRLARRSHRLRNAITDHAPGEVLGVLRGLKGHDDVDGFLAAFARFRQLHGHRAPREAELATPRWREDAGFLFEVIAGYIRAPRLPSARELERVRAQARAQVRAEVERFFPAGISGVFRGLLRLTRAQARQREVMRARVVDSLDIYRRYFLECGRRLVLQEAIRQPEDVFYLRVEDLQNWLYNMSSATDLAIRVLVARAMHEANAALPDPPDTFVATGQRIQDAHKFEASDPRAPVHAQSLDEIRGLPGSAGRVTGRARIIRDPNKDAYLEPGEILVAPYADIGWTPLFLIAAGIVTSLGGPLSHACIVAREYQIPTVVNAQGATERINTGDLITLDADRGIIYIRERA